MKTKIVCSRCGGSARMIDKAPNGESGDVVLCKREQTCLALHDAQKDLEAALLGAAEAGRDAAATMVPIGGPGVGIGPYPSYKLRHNEASALIEAVKDWEKAGEIFLAAVAAHGRAAA